MTDQEFCKIETAISGEEIDKVEQLTHCTFTGRELKEYLEQAFVIYGVSSSSSKEDLRVAFEQARCNKHSFEDWYEFNYC